MKYYVQYDGCGCWYRFNNKKMAKQDVKERLSDWSKNNIGGTWCINSQKELIEQFESIGSALFENFKITIEIEPNNDLSLMIDPI